MSKKRLRIKQWISVLLISGMIVTALPTVAYGASEELTVVSEGAVQSSASADGLLSSTAMVITQDKSFDAMQSAVVRFGKYSNQVQELSEGRLALKNSGEDYTRKGYMQFDLSDGNISTDDITQVRLVIYAFQQKSTNPGNTRIKVSAVSGEEWEASRMTAANAPESGEQLAVSGEVGTQYTEYVFDVTNYVKTKRASQNGYGKASFLLSSASYDSYAEIYVASQQISDQQYAPKLIVTYDVDVTEESSQSGGVLDVDGSTDNMLVPQLSTVERLATYGDPVVTFTDIEAAWNADQKDKLLRQASMKGSGTVSDPYLIYTAEDLMSMTENDNKCYKLMRDIDLEGKKWRPVGLYYWYPFMGYLDGNGHKITNLYVGGSGEDAWDISAAGLFGYFEGRVENLGVETVDAKRDGIDFAGKAGGIAGVTNAPAEIVNCYFNGRVAGAYSIGGLVGIAYPGTIIENCCALGTVDMSELFEYRFDNAADLWKESVDIYLEYAKYFVVGTAKTVDAAAVGPWSVVLQAINQFVLKAPALIDSITGTEYVSATRKCNIGGLVGLNYGTIKNSYAANRLYNVKTGITRGTTKVAAIAGRNIDGAEVENCYYDKDVTTDTNGDNTGYSGTTKSALRSGTGGVLQTKDEDSLTGKVAEVQWDFSAKTLANKSTDGYPLPKTHRISRSRRTDQKGDVFEPEVYYNSRVLMRTRESYFLSSRTTSAGSLVCPICSDEKTSDRNKAVTGIYQRGSISKPYHVHDIESLIAMQDYKESHFILCDDIDFLVSDGEKTVQKYWWPMGKTHFSPIKGSLKGNLSTENNRISLQSTAKNTNTESGRFAIKNLTVQHNLHAGFCASLRGTISDINFEISSGDWNSWRDGIKGSEGIIGISTVGDTASAAVIAGDTVAGALIRDCNVGGEGSSKGFSSANEIGYVKGSLRAGGVVGLLNRGAKITGCKVCITPDTQNYSKHFDEDEWQANLQVIRAFTDTAGAVMDVALSALERLNRCFDSLKDDIQSGESIDLNLTVSKWEKISHWSDDLLKVVSIFEPVLSFAYKRYGNVCTGDLAADAYGEARNCTVYHRRGIIIANSWFWSGRIFGKWNFASSRDGIGWETIKDSDGDGIESSTVSADVFSAQICDSSVSEQVYSLRNNIKEASIDSLKVGIRGLGTEEEPILVSDEADLRRIAQYMAEGSTFEDTYILQTNDIELTEDFECMGLSSRTPFKGVYDGNECKITGLNIEDEVGAALFYKIEGGAVCDLKIEGGRFIAPVAASIAIYAEDMASIYNCGSISVVSTGNYEGDDVIAAGLVAVLDDSFIANSYVNDTVSSKERKGGLVGYMNGVSQMAKCYSSAALAGEGLAKGLVYDIDSTCWWEQCYWAVQPDANITAFGGDDLHIFTGNTSEAWEDYDETYGFRYTSTTESARAEERHSFAVNLTKKTTDEIKSQSFVNSLNEAPESQKCMMDLSDKSEWYQGAGMALFNYPGHYRRNAKIRLVEPEYGSLTLEYRDFHDQTYTWQEVEFNEYGYAEVERGDYIKVTLNDLPIDKEVECWTINGVHQSDKTGNTITVMANQNASFAVRIKEGTPVQDQTRPLFISETLNGVAYIEVTDVYAEPDDEPWPSIEFTSTITGEPAFTIGSQNCSVDGDDNSLKSYLGVDYKKLTDSTGKIIYRIEIPYNAIVNVTFTPKNGYHLADYYQNGEKHTVESSSAYVVGPFSMTDSIALSFFGKAN